MNLRTLAAKNVWQNRGRYLAYLGSSAFSVMIYFLYTAMALHPYFKGGYRGAEYARDGIQAAAVVIAIFTLLFLLYSSAAFVRSRMKEFGLFTLMGLSRRQLVAMILWENLFVAATALMIGMGLGLLFLKLFFMVISLLLQLPQELPFYVGWPVWRQTLMVFGSMFLFASLLSLVGVLRRNIIELIRASRQPKEHPTFSMWKALLGFLLVGGGYAWAAVPNPVAVGLGVVPVTTMVSVGTYYMMREGSIAVLKALHRRPKLFYRPGPFLTVSQLLFKIQENYRVLSAAAILIAVILSAMGTVFTLYVVVEKDSQVSTPQAIELTLSSADDLQQRVAQVNAVLQKHGVEFLESSQWHLLEARLDQGGNVLVVPYSLYTSVYRPEGETLPLTADDDAVHVLALTLVDDRESVTEGKGATLHIGESAIDLNIRVDATGRLLNYFSANLVVSDALFERLVAEHPQAKYRTVALWTGDKWRGPGMREAVKELRSIFPQDASGTLTTTLETYEAMVSSVGLVLFIGLFVSLVFFAASCSLLYFRLFTEIDDDRRYYLRLQQLGVGRGAVRKLTQVQSAVVFFIPFLVGLVHSTFAMKALGTLVLRTVLHYGWMVAASYLVLYVAFFAATYAMYWRSLRVSRTDAAVDFA